jgi:hypothetical protein
LPHFKFWFFPLPLLPCLVVSLIFFKIVSWILLLFHLLRVRVSKLKVCICLKCVLLLLFLSSSSSIVFWPLFHDIPFTVLLNFELFCICFLICLLIFPYEFI